MSVIGIRWESPYNPDLTMLRADLTDALLLPGEQQILKKMTGYIATVRRQGTLQGGPGLPPRQPGFAKYNCKLFFKDFQRF
jgi:hypothetical protein